MNSYIGHPSQLSGVEEYRLIGGKATECVCCKFATD